MRIHIKKIRILAGTATAALGLSTLLTPVVMAGGFAVREQSAEFQGMSWAGNAASGGGLSGMFWNPAVAAYAPVGMYAESHFSGIFGNVNMKGDTFNAAGGSIGQPLDSGNIANHPAVVPSFYASYRASDRLVVAFSFNAPFGLATEPNRFSAAQTFARKSEIQTYNAAPTFAYQLMPTVSIGAGLQIQHIVGTLKSAASVGGVLADQDVIIKGDDTAFGYTAGVNWTPTAQTSIGLGFRSSINHNLNGTASIPTFVPALGGFTTLGGSIQASMNLPEIVTLSFRHQLNDKLAVLGTAEWSHWSRVEQLNIVCTSNGAPNLLCPTNGKLVTSLPLGWHDGWMMSVGGEYKYNSALTLRSGLAYEISPIQNAAERTQRTPDTDRLWLSAGATYKWSDKIAFDLGYSHIFGLGSGAIDRTSQSGGPATFLHYVGKVDPNIDIVSASLKIKLGDLDAPLEPMK